MAVRWLHVLVLDARTGQATLQAWLADLGASSQSVGSMEALRAQLSRTVCDLVMVQRDLPPQDLLQVRDIVPETVPVVEVPLGAADLQRLLHAHGLAADTASGGAMPAMMIEHELQRCVRDDLQHLRGAHQRGDVAEIFRFAHRIKGVALLFGAAALADIATRVETTSQQGRMPDATQMAPLEAWVAGASRPLRERPQDPALPVSQAGNSLRG